MSSVNIERGNLDSYVESFAQKFPGQPHSVVRGLEEGSGALVVPDGEGVTVAFFGLGGEAMLHFSPLQAATAARVLALYSLAHGATPADADE